MKFEIKIHFSFYFSRFKRFSDQKILDIEARIALAKLRGKPVLGNYGNMDLNKM